MASVPVANLKSVVKAAAEGMGGTYSEGPDGVPTITVNMDDKPKRRMAREPADTPLPLGDTTSRRGVDDRLRLLVERAETLEAEKQGIADDLKDVFAEAKAVGYCVKTIKQVMKLRKMRPDDRAEQETLLDVYKNALGLG